MRVLRIELYGDEPGNIPILIPVDDITLIIARNGVGKSLALEAIDGLLNFWVELKRRGRGDSEVNLFGWLHVRLNVADGPSSDWPWFRRLLALGFPGDVGSDIPDLDVVLGGPEQFESPADYDFALRHTDLTSEEDQSWGMFCERAHNAPDDPGLRLLIISLIGGDEIEVAMEMYPGGKIDLLLSRETEQEHFDGLQMIAPFIAERSSSDSVAVSVLERLSDPTAGVVHTIQLGHSSGDHRDWGALIERFPRVIRMPDVIGDPEPSIDDAIDRALRAIPDSRHWSEGRPAWIEDGPDGSARLRPEVTKITHRLATRANELLPPFISELGTVVVVTAPQSSWRDDLARSLVRFRFADDVGEAHFRMIGAGSRRWVAASLEAACGDLDMESAVGPSPLYLIDEPEMHLHPLAQMEVLRWIEERVAEGATAVLTTHSPLILATNRESATLLALVRHGRVVTQVSITESLLEDLGAIDGLATAVGSDRVAVLQVTRGILVVEGEHDKKVIKRFFGRDLDRLRIRLLPLRGHRNAMAVAESELLASLGIPLCFLFDDVREQVLARRTEGLSLSGEEREMIKGLDAMEHLREQGLRVGGVPFPLPDVICAIPLDAVGRAFPQMNPDVGWERIIDAWRATSQPRVGFKSYALKHLGLRDIHVDTFVENSLHAVQDGDRCAPEFGLAIKGAQANLLGSPTEPQ